MLLEADDLPLHQAPVSLAHVQGGHPNAYDRFFFNAYREDLYVAVAMGLYPNRGVIDAAVGVVLDDEQHSVFASGTLVGRETRVGPISIEVTEPMRGATVRVDAPEHGLVGELHYEARTVAVEEPRQIRHDGARLVMDHTRVSQLGTWSGTLEIGGEEVDLSSSPTFGTKDRSWGVRPVGEQLAAAPSSGAPQLYFVWTPLHFDDVGFHLSRFEDAAGVPWSSTAAVLDPLAAGASPVDAAGAHHLRAATPHLRYARGLRRPTFAELELTERDGTRSVIELEPLLTFRMRGIGYFHPTFAHGRYHGELVVHGERHATSELDTTSLTDLHVEQVVTATWGGRRGLGVLELLAIGPHAPSGLSGLADGAR
ncbi:MAG TPA: hypothetical protein VKT18_10115 [Acidimicrobiales bacterium]|nr:hypothetical protein [Acidimicrobiales bacterium]